MYVKVRPKILSSLTNPAEDSSDQGEVLFLKETETTENKLRKKPTNNQLCQECFKYVTHNIMNSL